MARHPAVCGHAGPDDVRRGERDHGRHRITACAGQERGLGAERGADHDDAVALPRQLVHACREQLEGDLPRARGLAGPAEPAHRLGQCAVLGEQARPVGVDATARPRQGEHSHPAVCVRYVAHTLLTAKHQLVHLPEGARPASSTDVVGALMVVGGVP